MNDLLVGDEKLEVADRLGKLNRERCTKPSAKTTLYRRMKLKAESDVCSNKNNTTCFDAAKVFSYIRRKIRQGRVIKIKKAKPYSSQLHIARDYFRFLSHCKQCAS